MPSVRTRPVLLALLAILALAVAAATLNSAVSTHGGGSPGDGVGVLPGNATGPESVEGASGTFNASGSVAGGLVAPCYPILNDPRVLLGIGVVAAGLGYGLYRREDLLVASGVLVAVGIPAAMVHTLLTACGAAGEVTMGIPEGGANVSASEPVANGSGGPIVGGGTTGADPGVSLFLLGALGVALVGAVALLVRSTGDDVETEDAEEDSERMAAIGRAAGRAADRIEDDADLGNAVYEAWWEMTTHLDVERPESSTPAEFAAAAVESGMNPDDVSELTALFEEVRYGEAEPTPEREGRAHDALRRIEEEYADADASDAGGRANGMDRGGVDG